MRLSIDHHTRYAYPAPQGVVTQALRLFASEHAGLAVEAWDVRAAGQPVEAYRDGCGNHVGHVGLVATQATVDVHVRGAVRTNDRGGRMDGLIDPLPPAYYLRETERTRPNDAIADLARSADGVDRAGLERFMGLVLDRIVFQTGATGVEATAAQALAARAGVCQDHAHVFIAGVRSLGAPARYVSGYLWTGRGEEPASHAWAEAYCDGAWIGFDPANRVFAGAAHIRLAHGLDYADAAPVVGVRRGAGPESMQVRLQVVQATAQ